MNDTYTVGIDEAGRGPFAGPVAVGTVKIIKNKKVKVLEYARDSKQISEKEREEVFDMLVKSKKAGEIDFAFAFSSSSVIDKKGIVYAIQNALNRNLKKLKISKHDQIFLDGSLKAPASYKKQKTIIKGDSKVRVIGLASIVAKVQRDRYMKKISGKYPEYSFHIHKGYGTVLHRQMIKKYGLTKEHRKSFNIVADKVDL
jgi:ribonuclease HII